MEHPQIGTGETALVRELSSRTRPGEVAGQPAPEDEHDGPARPDGLDLAGIARSTFRRASDAANGAIGVARELAPVGEFERGAAKAVLNGASNLVDLPIYVPRWHEWIRSQGAIEEARGPGQQAGADMIDGLLQHVGVVARPTDRIAERTARPVLASASITVHRDVPHVLTLAVAAPGADWNDRARAAGLVSVYVGGKHHSDLPVIAERDGNVSVNLGVLPPGTHQVEVRDARASAGSLAPASTAQIVGAHELVGDAALVARYQPILEGRDLNFASGRAEMAFTDAPLLLVPKIADNDDGSRTITYYVLFSGEDGGTSTRRLYRESGRSTDFDPMYSVRVDAAGNRLDDQYQGPRHTWYPFTGERYRDRPILRTATSNNNFSERIHDAGTRWSQLAEPAQGSVDAFDVMERHPWTFNVMARELERQRLTAGSGMLDPFQVEDPRSYLYLRPDSDPARERLEAGEALHLRLVDGSIVEARMEDGPSNKPSRAATIPLPIGVAADDIAELVDTPGVVWVIDDDFAPRQL